MKALLNGFNGLMKSPPSSSSQMSPVVIWAKRVGWGVWLSLLVLLPVGALSIAFKMLMTMPESTSCPRYFDAEHSDSLRIYCAQQLADEGTSDSLQQAIALLDRLPRDSPTRSQGDRLVQDWSAELLELAEEQFQTGHLDEAVELAGQVPPNTDAYIQARDRMDAWQAVWQDAEAIYSRADDAMALGNWDVALSRGRDLLTLDNRYWAMERYPELARRAQEGREQEQWLAEAAKRRRTNLTTSTEGRRTQWEQERDQRDLQVLQEAQALAQSSNVDDLREAIVNARRIIWGTPHYDQAQSLITTWQAQVQAIEDAPRLAQARQIASSGEVEDLESAIREARRIPSYRSLHPEAQSDIQVWQQQIREMTAESMTPVQEAMDERMAPWSPPEDPRSPLNPAWNPDQDERFPDAYGEPLGELEEGGG
ncbi:MAG: hypothetical protein IGR80_13730 [Synechococcales cyanobacterium K44_A2020_017]|nr:hypothetical protein [Synechococcales cyanobacterium K32_A2020_035]MBF2095804.1 hypothetical protein [Synechococcales cyanobacterium K44_A2020_017]